ncbi:MAG TPA: peptidylprolyl isomerase [Polyangiaceae bacterium]|nr:peptidylprolyl isomerase [Polyangiaceae bacterium]
MRRSPKTGLAPLALACGLGWGALTGCRTNPAPAGARTAGPIVATIGSVTLTASDLEARIEHLPPFKRRRFETNEKKREFLDDQVHFEALAAEGMKRGYANDPDVQQALKQLVVAKLLERDFEPKHRPDSVPDADVEDYFTRHADEFRQPERVRALEIVVPDAATAARVEQEAAEGTHGDGRAFAKLAARYSTDAATKTEGGDTGFFDRATTKLPKPLVDAAFALANVGDIAPPVALSDGGFAVLMLLERRPGFERSLADAKHDIQERLFAGVRQRALDAYVAGLMKSQGVTMHPEALAAVQIGPATSGAGPAAAPPVQSVSAR